MFHIAKVDDKLLNVIHLGICFMVLFAAYFTISNMQKTLISSISDERPDFLVEGYTVLGVLYSMFTVTLWMAPSIVAVIGIRSSFLFALIGYTLYIISFNLEESWAIHGGALLCGLGAGILWTAEGKYMVQNSDQELMSRNIGVFWVLFALSTFYGNIYAYFELEGKIYIDRATRRILIYVLTGISTLSIFMFLLLRPVKRDHEIAESEVKEGPLTALKKTWSVLTTKDMLILCITFLYAGMQQAFSTGIYSPCIGFTLQFGTASKQLVPISGLCTGVGSLIGGSTQIMMSKRISKHRAGRSVAASLGFAFQLLAYFLILLNLPNASVFGDTNELAIIESSTCIALACSILLGIGDCCCNTQIYSLMAEMFPESSAQSCALYVFVKGMLSAATYYSSNSIGLHKQLAILAPCAAVAAIVYCYVDRITVQKTRPQLKTVVNATG